MIKSMTGYGVGRVKAEEGECLVEIKSLNNKYCDINIKNNFQSLEVEQKMEKLIKDRVLRGKVNILVKVENYSLTEEKIMLNEDIADSCYKNLKILKEKYKLKDEIGLGSMLKFKDIFKIVQEEEGAKTWLLVEKATNLALDSLLKMKEREGKVLSADIRKRVKKMHKLIDKIEKYSKSSPFDYKDKFLSKIKKLTDGLNVDEGRIELEAAIFAEKTDITEEITRLKSHLIQFDNLLNSEESVGRKMDFLTQEINREVNTIGSKTNDIEVTSLVVLLKSELEKVREQARNIE
ncbi:YicC family protein [Candidatus Atribacteria bacterium RBG_19FT_COMBO_35_14]|uniref:YicC family protein n=1 Tax=Candidatus Sediminicultor quintus TaxID=1797291 RepID=A0A1F5A6U2_9BACT|nr:MAG: YicC family protein [Candidatus Atribacteria bacterium RBG_19FT_COMBO_35_14]